jgi:anti-sigma factor RsiW
MTCKDMKLLLHAYADGELDSQGSLSVENHLRECETCSRCIDNLRTLAVGIENGGLRFSAPPQMKLKLQSAIRRAAPRRSKSMFSWRWAGIAAAFVLMISISWFGIARQSASSEESRLVNEIVSNHVRSMMASHITDVGSSDSHTVKPWFSGKLDYSPPAKDLTEQGFRLIGGRLDYLANQPVAALVYQRSQHFINLFVWPSNQSGIKADDKLTLNGYNIIHWTRAGMTYWLISELNQTELDECARLLKE